MTPREMELTLMDMGYDEAYLATLGSSAIERLFHEEFDHGNGVSYGYEED